MTAAVYRNTPSLSVPQTQNTAPVLEFNCLYTHDVRKKQKKWQDGFLRYHTFNKRVMVYDQSRNLVGDMHWTRDEELQEGDELQLERCPVMVEVGDSIGQTETDLTELRKSRKKDSSTASPAPPGPKPVARPVNGTGPQRSSAQPKHRSLGALLGTPKGPLGKASFPQKSPFEERHAAPGAENEEWEEGRPPKRARTESQPVWNVTRTTTAAKPVKQAGSPLWARTADAANQKKKTVAPPDQPRLVTKEVIEIEDDPEPQDKFLAGFSDDALASSSPVKAQSKTASKPPAKPAARSSSPAFQTQHAPPPQRPAQVTTERGATDAGRPQPKPSMSTSLPPLKPAKAISELPKSKGDSNTKSVDTEPVEKRKPAPVSSRPTSSKTGQTLRLATSGPKKRTLLCQPQLSKKPKRISSTSTDSSTNTAVGDDDNDPSDRPMSARGRLQARLDKIDKKGGSTSSARLSSTKKPSTPIALDDAEEFADAMSDAEDDNAFGEQGLSHEASAIELSRLDEMMLPPAARPAPPPPRKPSPPPREERSLRRVASETVTTQSSRTKTGRVPGAPVRYTPSPSPTKQSRETTPAPPAADKQPEGRSKPPPPKAKNFKKPFQKSVSLNVTSNGTSTVILSKPFQAPGKSGKRKEPEAPKDLGPWSREAFDLFTWRPPNWDEEKWCVKETTESNDTGAAPAGLSGGVSLPHAR